MIYNNKSRTLCNPVRVLKNELINYLKRIINFYVTDQQSIKQKVRLLIKLDYREDILEFERDLLYDKENWQLCNINRIII